jgi:drug/metabolite transporter (DMT)-like permease
MRPNIGDGYELVSSLIWSLHVILTGWLVVRMDVKQYAIGQYLFCALFSLIVGLAVEGKTLVDMQGAWWAIIFTGVISVAIGYTLLAAAQRVAPPSDTVIILSVEAVFAALFGWLLLDEYLTPIQILGCGIILSGMLLSQSHLLRKESHA